MNLFQLTSLQTTVDQHPAQIGKECAKMFLKMVQQQDPHQTIEQILIDPALVERGCLKKYFLLIEAKYCLVQILSSLLLCLL